MNTTPIEFMAWHPTSQIMSMEFTLSDAMEHEVDKTSDDEVYLQLTALRSINDEYIYNHMIVKDNFKNHFVVDMFDYWKMWGLAESKLEIVGNRFQSPELLELCK